MSRHIKVMFRWFTIADFEEEELFLRTQHKSGWKFAALKLPGFYVFEKCEPEDVVYRLDYGCVEKDAKGSYLQMFEDCGWEYLFDVNRWSYFRKSAEEEEQNNDIFSDIETKIAFLDRVKRRMLPLLVMFFCVIVPQIIVNYMNMRDGVENAASKRLLVMFSVLFLLYLNLFLKFGRSFQRLKKRYLEGER